MRQGRIVLWLVIALSVPAQAMAAYSQRLLCFDHAGSTAPSVEMDCHSSQAGQTDHSAGQPDCCGDSCPDMTACTVSHLAGPIIFSQLVRDGRSAFVASYVVSFSTALFALPFRPPASDHA